MRIIDGKKIASEIRQELKDEIAGLRKEGVRAPGLAVILVGDNPASRVYVKNKQKACAETGIASFPFILPASTSQEELLELIGSLNRRGDVDGILLQLPLPEHIDGRECLLAIDPAKDVDGFHPVNMGNLALGLPGFQPCTPAGVIKMLERENFSLKGKKAVVIGRSDIVGKPLALLLARKNTDATVTICHSATPDLAEECKDADFIFVAIGRPETIRGDMVPAGCVVVDIGINRTENGLCGDAHFESVSRKAAAITPVPGGVGPMTIAMLLTNTVTAWKANLGKK